MTWPALPPDIEAALRYITERLGFDLDEILASVHERILRGEQEGQDPVDVTAALVRINRALHEQDAVQ